MMRALPILAALLLLSVPATAAGSGRGGRSYEITITNLTKGQTFTPILVATHSREIQLFEAGSPASDELEVLAEDGGTDALTAVLESSGQASDIDTIPGLLAPGESAVVKVDARRRHQLSVAAMLIPTNDTFFALNAVSLPRRGSRTFLAPAYDAGTEENDQNCANMPGPRCPGGEGLSADPEEGDEGFVGVGNGFHELGSEDDLGNEILGPFTYDWRNPVARVVVRRVK